jgi:hypothetical protein
MDFSGSRYLNVYVLTLLSVPTATVYTTQHQYEHALAHTIISPLTNI